MSRATIDQLADEILLTSFNAMEKIQGEYGHFPLDEVKDRRSGKRDIDSMLLFRKVFGDDLSTALTRSFREGERRGVIASDIELAAAARTAAWKISVETENYRKAVRTRPQDSRSSAVSALRPRQKIELLQSIPLIGSWLYNHYTGDSAPELQVTAPKSPARAQLGEREPTVEDRAYYGDILSDTTTLLLLTDPQLRKHLRQETSTGANISNRTYLRERIQKELHGALDRDILALDRGYRPEDKRILVGLRAVNAIMKTIEAFAYRVSFDSFRYIAGEHQDFMNEEIKLALGITLRDDEFSRTFEWCKPRLVDHEVDAAVQRVAPLPFREVVEVSDDKELAVPRPSKEGTPLHPGKTIIAYKLAGPKTQLRPYGTIPAAPLVASVGEKSAAPPTIEDIVELTPPMRRLKFADTIEDPVFLAALGQKLGGDTAREISRLFHDLEQLGINNGEAEEAINLFLTYTQSVAEIAKTTRARQGGKGSTLPIAEAQAQLAPTEREEYLSRYGTELGEKIFHLADRYVGKQKILEEARGIAEILSGERQAQRKVRNRQEEKLEELAQKYIALGLPQREATALARYEDRIADPKFNPNELQMRVVMGLINNATMDHLRRKATNGDFDSDTYATLLTRLFEGITPHFNSKRTKWRYNPRLDFAWKTAYERYKQEYDELGQKARGPEEEVRYQIMGRLAGKAQQIHIAYSELRIGPRRK